ADDDAIRRHTQRVANEGADANFAPAFQVRRPCFQTYDVLLVQHQLGRVFDRDHAVGLRNEPGKDVEQRRLTGTGAAADNDVQARLDAGAQEVNDGGRDRV